jgi:hypothetical protein
MQSLVISFLQNHQQWIEGLAVGFLLSNPGACATVLFKLFVKIPGVGAWIAANPDKAKAWADSFDKAIDEAIDFYAKPNVPK